ncbi:Glycosyltransferase [Acidisarcina polymorpha]|uniref:Glycosyltransferase n=1 Tax=Acidisarcina polymorpha TaxID=2211140 RepID=A0A2Z5FS04_9BACT|nr:glycosyltransferase family 4 protein [Acidisarcina polymorpha]AXC09493.1 Glycosyltransferase [Acidisarcina polymorpha]
MTMTTMTENAIGTSRTALHGKPIAVLHYDLLGGGGAEVVAFAMIRALLESGAQVVVYSSSPDPEARAVLGKEFGPGTAIEYRKVETRYSGPVPKIARVLLFNEALSKLRFSEAAVINTYSEFWLRHPHPATFAYIHFPIFGHSLQLQSELRGLGVWTKSGVMGTAISSAVQLYLKASRASFPKVLMTNSNWTARRIARLYGEAVVVQPPASVSGFDSRAEEPPDRLLRVVSIGRLVPAKRIPWLAQQIDLVARRIGKRVEYHIIGRGESSYIQELRQSLSALSSVDAVIHADVSTAERNRVLRAADVGVHGFPCEHFGLAVAEMMASGIPVLTPRNGGLGEQLFESGQSYTDAEDFKQKLEQMLSDPALSMRLRSGNLKMSKEFSPESFSQKIVEVVGRELQYSVL